MSDDKKITDKEKEMNKSLHDEVNNVETEPEDIIELEDGEVEVIKEIEKEEEPKLTPEEILQEKVNELEDKLMRRAAEFENYKKRTARQFDEIIQSANDRIILEFLDVVDNFSRSFDHDNEETNVESFKEGVNLIYNQMKGLLEKYDIKPFDAVGQPFNPDIHDAMMQVESDEFDEGTVAMEIGKGYKMGDRVIRHSKVGVAKAKGKDEANEENREEKESNETEEK